jgi:hypothetical protein
MQQLRKERLRSMLAVIAVLGAVATGLGIGLVPAVHAGALDGFAAGLPVSGTIFLLLMGQWHGMRRAEPVASAAFRIAALRLPGRLRGSGQSRRPVGYRSRHRLSGPEDSPSLPDGRRAPRHAAPSSVKVRRRGGSIQVKALIAAE